MHKDQPAGNHKDRTQGAEHANAKDLEHQKNQTWEPSMQLQGRREKESTCRSGAGTHVQPAQWPICCWHNPETQCTLSSAAGHLHHPAKRLTGRTNPRLGCSCTNTSGADLVKHPKSRHSCTCHCRPPRRDPLRTRATGNLTLIRSRQLADIALINWRTGVHDTDVDQLYKNRPHTSVARRHWRLLGDTPPSCSQTLSGCTNTAPLAHLIKTCTCWHAIRPMCSHEPLFALSDPDPSHLAGPPWNRCSNMGRGSAYSNKFMHLHSLRELLLCAPPPAER